LQNKFYWVGLVVQICYSGLAHATRAAADFDINNDGLISSSEFRLFALDSQTINLNQLDANDDGKFSADDLGNANKPLNELLIELEAREDLYVSEHPQGLSLVEFDKIYGLTPAATTAKRNWLERNSILIRGKLEKLDFTSSIESANKATAAQVSFNRDIQRLQNRPTH